MKFKIYSFRNAKIIFENDGLYKNDWFELLDVLENISEDEVVNLFEISNRKDIKSLSEPINKIIDDRLKTKGWRRQCEIFNDSEYRPNSCEHKNPWTIDFSKNEFAIEVAFNHGQVVAWNLIKLVLAGELNHVEKDINTSVGIVVCATDELKKNGGFDNAVGSFEKFLQHLKPMNNLLTIPIAVIGLCDFENYIIINKKAYKKNKLLSEDKNKKIDEIFEYLTVNNFNIAKNTKYRFDGKIIKNIPLISEKMKTILYNSRSNKQTQLAKYLIDDNWKVININDVYSYEDLDVIINDCHV